MALDARSQYAPPPRETRRDGAERLFESRSDAADPLRARGDGTGKPTYYDIPLLKRPTWGWEIASYFFLGGLSAGAYILARSAERFGGEGRRDLTRAGTAIAALAFLPCPPLLIKDLGDPGRFHHMLRVVKPISPMSVGSWTLTAYGGILSLAAFYEWSKGQLHNRDGDGSRSWPGEVTAAVLDGVGIPIALMMAGYTGVLLSTSSTPVWARNPWLGPLFTLSALHTGAAALDAALAAAGSANGESAISTQESRQGNREIGAIESVSRLAEAGALAGYLAHAGRLADPLARGRYAPHLWGGVVGAGMALPAILKAGSGGKRASSRWLRLAAPVLSLVGGFALRWAIVHAGHPSADNPAAAHEANAARK